MYVFGCKLSLVRLCDNEFGITPVDDITIGIAHTSFASSWQLFCLSAIIIIIIIIIIVSSPLDLYMAYAMISQFLRYM